MRNLFTLFLMLVGLNIAISVKAETYKAGEYTIILEVDYDEGKTYYGCDQKDNCLYLIDGTSWQNDECRGITWENKGYTYSVSWSQIIEGLPLLKVYDSKNQLILERSMVIKPE